MFFVIRFVRSVVELVDCSELLFFGFYFLYELLFCWCREFIDMEDV